GNGFTVDNARLFDCSDGKTGQVVLAIGVHAGHFSRFAADQGASGQLAALGNAADNAGGGIDRQLAAGEVIKKIQRLGALHQNVVDAHGDQVYTHGIMTVP